MRGGPGNRDLFFMGGYWRQRVVFVAFCSGEGHSPDRAMFDRGRRGQIFPSMRHLALRVRGRAIDVAVAEGDRRTLTWIIPNRPASVRRLVKLVGTGASLRACCEDGPQAYVVYWQLAALGVDCDLVVKMGGDVAALAAAQRDGRLALVWAPAAALSALEGLGGEQDRVEDRHQPFTPELDGGAVGTSPVPASDW